jgi:hypothetical protein
MVPAATEAWPAVFGGLIPILGLAGAAYLLYRAVKDDPNDPDSSGADDPDS